MSLKILVVDEYKELLREPYVVRLGGWTLERYLAEALESSAMRDGSSATRSHP